MKSPKLLNFISALLLSAISIQSCDYEKLIPATNQPELTSLNLDNKVNSSVSSIEKTDNKDFINPELSPSPANNLPKVSAIPVNNIITDIYTKTPVPIISISPVASSEPIKKIYAMPLSTNAGKITAYLTYSSDLIGKVLVNLQNINETPTKLKLLDQYGNSVLDSNTFKFNVSGHIVSDFSKQVDQKLKKLQLFFANGNMIEVDITDGFLSVVDFPTPISPIPTPVPTPELPTIYPQTFIPTPIPFIPTPILNTGIITTIAGNGTLGFSGDGGLATNASLSYPDGVAVDSSGNVYFSDAYNHRIRKIDAVTGIITTIAGTGIRGFSGDGELATNTSLYYPYGVAVDSSGNVYFSDTSNNRIRKITAVTGIITTIAGNGTYGFSEDGGLATNASLYNPFGVAVDSSGNVYFSDTYNNKIRKIDAVTGIITTIAGTGIQGFSGDGELATNASLYYPYRISLDSSGNVYFSDTYNHRIRKIDAVTGIITTIAGTGVQGFSGDGELATNTSLYYPYGISLDSSGNIYFSDTSNHRIRKIDAVTGIITTIAGTGIQGFSGDGGLAINASLIASRGVTVDSSGNVYFSDFSNHRIRKITP